MNKPKKTLGTSASAYVQFKACQRKWYIGYVMKPDVPKTPALQTGIDVHDWLEAYLKGEEPPEIDEKLVNIAKAGIEFLPEPGTVQVEEWVEDICGPLPFRGKVDFYTCKDGVLHISDHKTTSRSSNAKTSEELSLDPQMLAYAYVLARKLDIQPKAIKFSHIYYLTKSKIPTSFRVDAEAKWEDVEKNWRDFERVAKVMSRLARSQSQRDVMPDTTQCRFCWFKEHCTAYQKVKEESNPTKKKTKKGEDMNVLERIREQKEAQRKQMEKLEKLEKEAKAALSISHPKSPEPKIDWKRLANALIETIGERERDNEMFPAKSLFDFLEYQLDRTIQQSDIETLMEATDNQLERRGEFLVLKKQAPKLGLSHFIQMIEAADHNGIPPRWTLEQVKTFWKKVFSSLSRRERVEGEDIRDMAKDSCGSSRKPRKTTIHYLLQWVRYLDIQMEMDESDCSMWLGASAHEVAMAHKLAAAPVVEEPKPEPVVEEPVVEEPEPVVEEPVVEEPKPEPVVEEPTPVVEESTAPAKVLVFINAYPSDHNPQPLSKILQPLCEEVAEEHGLPYFNLVKYNKGPSYVVSKAIALMSNVHASEFLGQTVFASVKDPCVPELTNYLERRADIVIIRGFFG